MRYDSAIIPFVNRKKPKPRSRAGRPSAAEAEGRIERLLDVAAEVFVEKGFDRASVYEIVKRAGASKETVYRRFPTKGELFSAVMRRQSGPGFDFLHEIVGSGQPVAEVLTAYAAVLVFPLVDKASLRVLRTVTASAETFPEVGRRFWEIGPVRVHQILADFLRKRMAAGELRNADPIEAAELFVALCTGRFWSHGLFGIRPRATKADVEAYTALAVRSFLSLYRQSSSDSC